jgi:hypothetical protein
MHYAPFAPSFATGFAFGLLPILALAAVWTIILKGFALWHAARNGQKWWFIALLIVNTLGILEIVYIVWFRPDSPHAVRRGHAHHDHAHTPAHDSSESKQA